MTQHLRAINLAWFVATLTVGFMLVSSVSFAQQERRGSRLVDEDYRFELRAGDESWTLMDQGQAQRAAPDAVAGLVAGEGRMALVIVEPLPEGNLEGYRALVRSSINETMTVEDESEIEWQGRTAYRIQFTGTISGTTFRFVRILTVNQGFGYQVAAWGLESEVGDQGESLQEVLDAFRLIEGEPSIRSSSYHVDSYDAVGVQVRDGIFRSGVSGLTVEPPKDWRLILGSELQQMNPDAEVGFAAKKESIFGLVVTEAVDDSVAEDYLETMDQSTLEELRLAYGELTEEPPVEWQVGDNTMTFKVVTTSSQPRFRYYRTAAMVGGKAVRLLAWHFAVNAEHQEQCQELFRGVSFMDAEGLAAFRAQLQERPDPQTVVGPGFSLRKGIYRFFPVGLTWRKPQGMWRMLLPEEAALINPEGLLIAAELETGLWGMILAENIADLNLSHQEYHELVVNQVYDDGAKALETTQEIQRDGQSYKASLGDRNFEGLPFTYRAVTTINEGIAYQLLVWGMDSNEHARVEELDRFWQGVGFAGGPIAETLVGRDGVYRDYRTGFGFNPPGFRWKQTEQLRPELSGMGNQVLWNRPGQFVMVTAIQPDPTAVEPAAVSDLASQFLQSAYGDLIQQEAELSTTTLGGLPCEQQLWRGERETVAAMVTQHEKITYFVVVFDATGKFDGLLEWVQQKFQWVDPLEPSEERVPDTETPLPEPPLPEPPRGDDNDQAADKAP